MTSRADPQTVVHQSSTGRIVCMDSAYDVDQRNHAHDVVVTGSYSGVLCARFVSAHRPKGAIGVDCAIGLDGSAIAGLWFYEALGIAAAAVDVCTVELGNGLDVYQQGRVSRCNEPARQCGVELGMSVEHCAKLMLENTGIKPVAPAEVTNRTTVYQSGRYAIVCTDSIAFALPEDAGRNVLCTGGHTGRSAVPYLRSARPLGFICSDGGGGRDQSGTIGLNIVEQDGLAGAAVDVRTARMGDGLSTYHDGILSAVNEPAYQLGLRIGMPARFAARLFMDSRGQQPA